MKAGAYEKANVEVELPTGRQKYDWGEIKKTVEDGLIYVLPDWAKKNSIQTGIRREEIKAQIGTVKGTEQLCIVPK